MTAPKLDDADRRILGMAGAITALALLVLIVGAGGLGLAVRIFILTSGL